MNRYFMQLDDIDRPRNYHVYDRVKGLGNRANEHNAIAICRDADVAQRIVDYFNMMEALWPTPNARYPAGSVPYETQLGVGELDLEGALQAHEGKSGEAPDRSR